MSWVSRRPSETKTAGTQGERDHGRAEDVRVSPVSPANKWSSQGLHGFKQLGQKTIENQLNVQKHQEPWWLTMMPLILTVALLRRAEHLRNQLNFVEMWLTETTGPPRACLECWTALKMTKPEVGNRNRQKPLVQYQWEYYWYRRVLAHTGPIWGGTIWEYFILGIGLLGNRSPWWSETSETEVRRSGPGTTARATEKKLIRSHRP